MPELDKEDMDLILGYIEKAFPPAPAGGPRGWTSPFAPQR
jgi:hypothetical protein